MRFRLLYTGFLLVLLLLSTCFAAGSKQLAIKPNKVALVIGDQWQDQLSFVVNISNTQPLGRFDGYRVDDEFSSLVIMLKSWGIPFEIIRLDQEFMDINRFIGPDGKATVGCIIWDADQTAKLLPQRYEVLRGAVNDYGISIIALANRIKEPIIQELLGIKYIGSWMTDDEMEHSGGHFITKGLKNPLDYTNGNLAHKKRVKVELTGAKAIVKQGKYPQVTVRELSSGARAVWIGGDIDLMFSYQEVRSLLRRSITFGIGYSLFKTWENKAWMIMDDPGTAANVWLDHWHYATLAEERIEKYLIEPLKKHNALLIINVTPGFVNDELKRVEPSFRRKFTDEFGTYHDYPSTKRGLVKGMKAGVIEIQCHGLTHMQPDLWSKPGPWYDSAIDEERAEVGWYQEFGDSRRGKEIGAAEGLWRLKTGIKWVKYHFGITPLSITPGGGEISSSYANHTYRLAALAGYGWGGNRGGYLGPDLAVSGWDFFGTLECPLKARAMPDGHDKGIAEHPERFIETFENNPNVEWMGFDEYTGYIHAKVSRASEKGFALRVEYDGHYCRHFENNDSEWNLLVSDWLAQDMGKATIKVDDKDVIAGADLSKELKIKIPAGLGSHNIEIGPGSIQGNT